jgi:hypothetical protein
MARLEKEATRLLLHTAELTRQVVRTELILQGRLR